MFELDPAQHRSRARSWLEGVQFCRHVYISRLFAQSTTHAPCILEIIIRPGRGTESRGCGRGRRATQRFYSRRWAHRQATVVSFCSVATGLSTYRAGPTWWHIATQRNKGMATLSSALSACHLYVNHDDGARRSHLNIGPMLAGAFGRHQHVPNLEPESFVRATSLS